MGIWEEKGRTNTAFNTVSDHQGNCSLTGPFTPGGRGAHVQDPRFSTYHLWEGGAGMIHLPHRSENHNLLKYNHTVFFKIK